MKVKVKKAKIKTKVKNKGLNLEQEDFCKCYVSNDREMFGNGVQSYIEVYGPDKTEKNWYKTACACASRLLTNAKVIKRINELLEEGGFNDVNVDKELSFLIGQHAELSTKLSAIKEYNRLKARVSDKEGTNINIMNASMEDLLELIKK